MFCLSVIYFDSKIIIYLQAGGAQETELQSGRGAAEGEDWPEEAGAEGHVAPLSSGRQDVAAVRQLGQVRSEGNITPHITKTFLLSVQRRFSIFEGAEMSNIELFALKLFLFS